MAPGAAPPPPALRDAGTPLAPLPCPRCTQPLEPKASRCGACNLPLTGLVAASLWSVDQRIAALNRERAAILAQLVASDDRGAARVGAGSPPSPQGDATASTSDGSQGAQRVLLVAGVVLVTASALGLGALAVTRLGALGQLAVLALLVAGALAASRWSLVRRLTASGESFAVLAVALAATGAGAVRSRGVIGPETVPDRAWPLVVVASLCLLSVLAAATLRRDGRPMAFGWAALATGALVPSMLAVLLDVGGAGLAAVLLGAAALLPLVAPALRSHGPVARGAVLVVAVLHLVVGALVATGLLLDVPEPPDALALSGVLAALAVAALLWRLAARRPGEPAPLVAVARSASSTAVVVAWAAGGGAVLAAVGAGGRGALVVAGTVLALAAAAALAARAPLPRAAPLVALATAAACLVLQAAWGILSLVPDLPASPSVPSSVPAAWTAVSLAAAVAALRPPQPRGDRDRARPAATAWAVPTAPAALVWTALSGTAAVVAALALPADLPSLLGDGGPRVSALALVATVALALAAAHRSRAAGPAGAGVEGVLVGVWAAALGLAVLVPFADLVDEAPGAPTAVRAVLALGGAQALLHGLLPGRAVFRALGVLVLSWAWWLSVGDLFGPHPAVEAWSLPPAVLALGVGAATWRSHPSLPSGAVLGPGLLAGLAPSAVWASTVDAPGGGTWVRPSVVVLVAVVVAVAGTRLSWQAPLVVGAAAAVAVALSQVGPYVARAPVWLTTGLAGVVVLALAVRLEVARRSSARALSWLAALR